MSVITNILAPAFLTSRIEMIAILLGSVLLVIFSNFVNHRIIFPIADFVRDETHSRVYGKINQTFSKYLSESLATIIFLVYCYVGGSLLAEYIFAPILVKAKNFILIIAIILFLLISYSINDLQTRTRFLGSP